MSIAKLHGVKLNILSTLKEKTMALFLYNFFESCGIVSTLYTLNYFPKKRIESDSTIVIFEEEMMQDILYKKEDILLIHSSKNEENCYSQIDVKNCSKILNYLFLKWNLSIEEIDELNALFQIYVKNDFWNVRWLIDTLDFKEGNCADKFVEDYCKESCQTLQKDLETCKCKHSFENHYLEHMKFFSLYSEYNSSSNGMERFLNGEHFEDAVGEFCYQNNYENYLGLNWLMANFRWNFQKNWAWYEYNRLEKEYPNSLVFWRCGLLKDYTKDKIEYFQKSYQADPFNYLGLLAYGVNLRPKKRA